LETMPHRSSSLQTSIALERDHFKVELSSQKHSYEALWRDNEKLRSIIDVKDAELVKQKQQTIDAQRSTNQLTRTLSALNKELRAAEAAEKAAKEYSRSIEMKITGSCPKVLVEKCVKLKQRLTQATSQLSHQAQAFDLQHDKLEKAEKEIRILLRALEIRTDELGLTEKVEFHDGYNYHRQHHEQGAEVKAGLLYELSTAQEKVSELEAKLEETNNKCDQLKKDYASLLERYEAEQRLRSKTDLNVEELNKQLTRLKQDSDAIVIEKESVEKDLQRTYRYFD
jgi:chromosome segregation ATPase